MERPLGLDHLDTLTTRNNLAVAYRDAGRAAEAIPLVELPWPLWSAGWPPTIPIR